MNADQTGERRTDSQPAVLISVVIPVFRDWERLKLCLRALEQQSLPKNHFEIILVNNEAHGRSTERLPSNARLIHEPRPGSYAARNAAVAASHGQYLAFTDSDCIPDTDWLKNGLRALAEHAGARIAGAVNTFREEGSSYYAYLYDHHTAFRQEQYVEAGFCATANLLVERRMFERVGPFDERFSGGDFEWNMRAKAAGFPIAFAKDVLVEHPARSDLKAIMRKRRRKAGAQQDARIHRYVLGRLVAPVRQVRLVRRSGAGWGTTAFVAGVHFFGSLAEIVEFALIRFSLKKPNRS